ncbi:HAD family hydrolase [Lactiplantibacillus modestisalitolerans]|uniref:HAD family hydrolase n=1 Tax=Lactiplantibacillus modestisalitolerans TaxID=1457219 RepID=A0ABV5WWI3_9LACO|nr:HAD-IA family hydrolase [Lactiplantibacillus modestisalitolerans]
MSYKTILFDVDNTLIDSATIASNVLHQITANYGFDVPAATVRQLVGIPTDKILQQLNLSHVDEITADFTTAIAAHKDELRYFNGIRDLLAQLPQRGVEVGIVTSRTAVEIESDLGAFPEITSADIIVTADKTTEHKPSGAPLEYAVNAHHLNKAETMYVGDAIYDMQAALDANMAFASATWGALPTTDFSQATFTPKTPADLLRVIA